MVYDSVYNHSVGRPEWAPGLGHPSAFIYEWEAVSTLDNLEIMGFRFALAMNRRRITLAYPRS